MGSERQRHTGAYHDVRWLDLHDAKVTAATATGLYTARFGSFLQQMDRQDFVITGILMPVVTNLIVEAKFHLVVNSEKELFYRLDAATVP